MSPTVNFKDLGLDSLDVVECIVALEDEFGVLGRRAEKGETAPNTSAGRCWAVGCSTLRSPALWFCPLSRKQW